MEVQENQQAAPSLPVLVCPICNRQLIMGNSNFNKHVDECLNKVEVKAILKDQMDRVGLDSVNNGSGSSCDRPSPKRVKR